MSNPLRKQKRQMQSMFRARISAEQKQVHKRSDYSIYFEKVFKSMQFINYSVLNDNFDFSKRKMKNYCKFLNEANEKYAEEDAILILEYNLCEKLGFDFVEEAKKIPLRSVLKIAGAGKNKLPNSNTLLLAARNGLRGFMILAVHVLCEHYRFSRDMILEWWNRILEVLQLYSKGMNNQFVKKYLSDYANIKEDEWIDGKEVESNGAL